MIYLFIHQSFPGQFLHIVRHLAARPGNTVYFVCRKPGGPLEGVQKIVYSADLPTQSHCHPLTQDLDRAIRIGATVADACRGLRREGLVPDLIVGHCGWGEMLFVKDVFPDTPVLSYFEFYYHATGVDLDFDPEFASLFQTPDNLRTRNGISLMSFDSADWGLSPTQWQRSLLPPEMRGRVTVLHEGVDTNLVRPNLRARVEFPDKGLSFSRSDEIITYVMRNLEPYRGFHSFMRALPEIQRRRPGAHIVIGGSDEVHYSPPPPPGKTYREVMLEEVGGQLDLERVHFVGRLPYGQYLQLLQVSSVHIYLTYPFMLSWSFIEAMASGCLIVGSDTQPVTEVLSDNDNGLAVDFLSPEHIAERVDEALSDPTRGRLMREAARRTAVERYDLHDHILPRWEALFDNLISGNMPQLDP